MPPDDEILSQGPCINENNASQLFFGMLWLTAGFVELLLLLSVLFGSFCNGELKLLLVIISFALLTYETWFGRVISRLILEACLCAAIVLIFIAVAVLYAQDFGIAGVPSIMPVATAVLGVAVFGLFTVGLLLKSVLLKMKTTQMTNDE